MALAGDWSLLEDPECRSGYEYARRRTSLWRGRTIAELKDIAVAFYAIYQANDNRHSLGMAVYLRQLITDGQALPTRQK